jgi:hypothetical protein
LAFVLRALDEADYLLDEFEGESVFLSDAFRGFVPFNIRLEDRIQRLVGRQGVCIFLVWTQFGRGRLLDDWPRYDLAVAIELAADRVDPRLDEVSDHGERTHHVAVKRAIANSHF